jgi:hypothetical protein
VWRSRSLGSSPKAMKASSRKGCLLGLRKINSRLEEAMVADPGGVGIWHGGEGLRRGRYEHEGNGWVFLLLYGPLTYGPLITKTTWSICIAYVLGCRDYIVTHV